MKEEKIVEKLKELKGARNRLAKTMDRAIAEHESLMKILKKEDDEFFREETRLINQLARIK